MVRARRETLLCLGAVQSPQLLELSGVGDPALLARLGIPLAHARCRRWARTTSTTTRRA